jgi:hypothetical protein
VRKLFRKLVIKEEAKANRESDKIEALIARAKKLVDKEEAKTNREAKTLMAGVDFSKEVIVLVRWETGGPPQGYLGYEVKGNGVNFFVQGPPLVDERGIAILRRRLLIHGADFFAVSKGVTVTFDPQERPYGGR